MDKKITIYDGEDPDIPKGINGFMTFWNRKISEIPVEFQDSTKIVIDADGWPDGCASIKVKIYYYRPETDEERQYREERENLRTEATRQREIEQFERLRKKYGQ